MDHAQSSTPHSLADALGDVRAEIRALRAREATLRQALIEARPNRPLAGQRYEVLVRESRRRVFDRDSLPDAILGDDRFWKTRITQTVVTRDRGAADTTGPAPRPGVLHAVRAPTRDLFGQDTDLVLIEDF